MMNKNFIFLICSERSGSNFITKIVDSHPHCSGPSPVHLIRYFAPIEWRFGDLKLDHNWQFFISEIEKFFKLKISNWNTEIEVNELTKIEPRNLAKIVEYLYKKEAGDMKTILIKENHAYRLLPFYNLFFPDSKLLWMHRDPRDMALSWKKDALLRGGIVRSSGIWKNDQRESLSLFNLLHNSGRIHKLSYESLISNAEFESKKICNFIGIEYDPIMLDSKNNSSSKNNAEASLGWSNLNKDIIKNNSNKFLDELNKEEIQFIEYYCKEEMELLNYEFIYPIVSREEFIKLQYNLSLNEKYEKPEYLKVSEAEKLKRKIWVDNLNQLYQKLELHK